jgi:asparaginyl-tRNA synthetase
MTYDEAISILQKAGFDLKWGDDFGAPEEKFLTEQLSQPIFIVKYPKKIKAFYMKVDPSNPKLVLNCDMLAPEGFGEMVGASERETDYEDIIARLNANNENISHYQWYLDLRKYGSVPHSGFGLGIERVVRWICKQESIRDTIPFPRTINRKYP